ncbi:Splicing factor [Gryganskiella cystojenkinii]|nr:Splicing factor [Gryganskiella cystojenkinii]
MASTGHHHMDLDSLSDTDEGIRDTEMDGPNPETKEAIHALKSSLEQTPNQYEQHLQLINLLKESTLLDELRDARENMSKTFPLTEALWLDWIKDESSIAISEDDKKRILELYEKATADYLSIAIWKSYVDYVVEEYEDSQESPEDEAAITDDEVRSVCSRAIKFTEFHLPKSHTIWNTWMDFELRLLDEQKTPSQEQINKLKTSYQDRLGVPHTDIDGTLSSLSSFITKYASAEYESSMVQYNKKASATRAILEKLSPYEDQLVETENSLEAFTAYLDYERRSSPKSPPKSFGRMRTLFERALTVHCLVPTVWNDYLSFLMSPGLPQKEFDLNPTEVLNIAERAHRNCPWSGDLWEDHILFLETYARPLSEIDDVVNKALADTTLLVSPTELVKVLLAKCVYLFRRAARDEDGHTRVRQCFEQAIATVQAAGGDPYYKLERQWIELEAGTLGDHVKARSLWEAIITSQKTLADNWIGFVEFERRLGSAKGARRIFVRACTAADHLDWPERVMDAWLTFERVYGEVNEYKDALTRTRAAMKKVEVNRAKAALEQQAQYATPLVAVEPQVVAQEPSSAAKPKSVKKRKGSITEDAPSAKALKLDETVSESMGAQADSKSKETETDALSSESSARKTKSTWSDLSLGRHEDTCFVTNFPRDTTDKQLKSIFEKYGKILRCNVAGKQQTIAYVQFSTPEEAHAALALDGHDMGERRGLMVKISDTNRASRNKGLPPLPTVSLHELRVQGLPEETKEEELKKLVSLYAEPTEVYIHRNQENTAAVWANIKFNTEASLIYRDDANAALSLNGHVFYGKTLDVTRRQFISQEKKNRSARREEARRQKLEQEGGSHEHAVGESDKKHKEGHSGHAPATETTSSSSPPPSLSSAMPPPAAVPTKIIVKTTMMSMAPRHVAKRSAPSRGGRAPRPAFSAHSAPSATTALTGAPAASSSSEAPKTNAYFSAMWQSGALKKKTENTDSQEMPENEKDGDT